LVPLTRYGKRSVGPFVNKVRLGLGHVAVPLRCFLSNARCRQLAYRFDCISEVPSVVDSFGRFASQSGFFRFEKLINFLDDFHEPLRVLFVHRLLAQFIPAF
jgi:hypothetical protein